MPKSILTISDTPLGYGSPQVLLFTRSLAELLDCDHLILQPFHPHRKHVDVSCDGFNVRTIVPPHLDLWSSWCRNYLKEAALYVNEKQPAYLVITNYTLLPILDFLTYRPKYVIHLALEGLNQFRPGLIGQTVKKKIIRMARQVDVWIFPERNRAVYDCGVFEIPYDRVCVLYNVSDGVYNRRPVADRNGRFIYAGTVHLHRTIARHFIQNPIQTYPIDVFGTVYGAPEQIQRFHQQCVPQDALVRGLSYFGEIPATDLNKRLPSYLFSLVYWFPVSWAYRHAAPNKFFQALAAGVPVIVPPHPQCVRLIERYNCGIILKDWDLETLNRGLKDALELAGSPAYAALVQGCQDACRHELSWPVQYDRIRRFWRSIEHIS